ncbi:MAG: YkgJ family cysteine cluster protein [Bacteroidetes bacterium]|nr:YkgJ family cysteine cluster protein [Bacteroidota bacterium]
MKEQIKQLPSKAASERQSHKALFKKLKRKPPKNLDRIMNDLHEKTFERMNCLDCANCCKTTSPIFTDRDIKRISNFLKLKPRQFEDQYLRKDEDGDMVLQSSPCPFLFKDNTCMIYEVRPKACAEYPHTNRKKFYQITNLTLKNMSICPAAFEIVERLKTII